MSTPSASVERPGVTVTLGGRSGGGPGLADVDALNPRLRVRRAVTLLLLTLVAPGSAQVVAGGRRWGSISLRAWVATLGAVLLGVLLFVARRSWALSLYSRSWFLLVLAIALIVGAVWWGLLFLDTLRLARLSRTAPRARALIAGLGALLMVATSGTLSWGAANVLAARTAVLNMFGGAAAADSVNGRYNVLLLGGDSGVSRVGTRPDTLMVASIDADTGKTVLFGVSRDTENINFRPGSTMAKIMPEGWNCGDDCLLNDLYTWAVDNKAKFPASVAEPGLVATEEAVEAFTGLDIQYYAMVDLKGFTSLVDAMGGLTINVKEATAIGGGTSKIKGYIEPGIRHLSGYEALWYARSRAGASNYVRMARQRCVMSAIMHQMNPQTVILKFQGLAAVSGQVLKTNLPEAALGGFADLALKARGHKITTVNFVPPLINPWRYDAQVVKDKVAATIAAAEKDESAAKPSATSTPKKSTAGGSNIVTPGSQSTAKATATAPATSDDLESVCSAV